MIRELPARIRYWRNADRLGPDIPWTHWRLYFRSTMRALCRRKFRSFGEGAEFRPGAYADGCSLIDIGALVVIRPGTFLYADPRDGGAGIVIEEKVLIGPGVHFYANDHAFGNRTRPIFDQGYPPASSADTIILRRGCWVGAGAIILRGVEIGENAVVGAGTVVTKSVPPHCIAVGSKMTVLER